MTSNLTPYEFLLSKRNPKFTKQITFILECTHFYKYDVIFSAEHKTRFTLKY